MNYICMGLNTFLKSVDMAYDQLDEISFWCVRAKIYNI